MSLIRNIRRIPVGAQSFLSRTCTPHVYGCNYGTMYHQQQIYVTLSIRSFASTSTHTTSTATSTPTPTPTATPTSNESYTYPPLQAKSSGSTDQLTSLFSRYYNGGKLLFSNFSQFRQIQKRLKADPNTTLTREESRLLYWFKRDAAAGGPFLAWFLVPVVGYTAPIVFHFMPQYLPSTFWTPEVRQQLRSSVEPLHSDVLTALHTIIAEHEAVLDLPSARPLRECMTLITRVREGYVLSDSELQNFQSVLSNIIDWNHPRFQELESALHWFGNWDMIGDYIFSYMDSSNKYVNSRFHAHIEFLKKDDAHLASTGVTHLHGEELIQALYERGLYRNHEPLNEKDGHALLQRWITWTSEAVKADETYKKQHPPTQHKDDHHDDHGHEHVDPRSQPGYGNAFFVYAGALMRPGYVKPKKRMIH